jgi:hypothetical protein
MDAVRACIWRESSSRLLEPLTSAYLKDGHEDTKQLLSRHRKVATALDEDISSVAR